MYARFPSCRFAHVELLILLIELMTRVNKTTSLQVALSCRAESSPDPPADTLVLFVSPAGVSSSEPLRSYTLMSRNGSAHCRHQTSAAQRLNQ